MPNDHYAKRLYAKRRKQSEVPISMADLPHTSFYAQIGQNYGQETLELFKAYANNNQKLGNMLNRKNFLIECRRKGFIPSHIVHSLKCVHELLAARSPYARKLTSHIARVQKSLLNTEIQDAFHNVKTIQAGMSCLRNRIVDTTVPELYWQFLTSQEFAFYTNLQKITEQTNQKFIV